MQYVNNTGTKKGSIMK